jgi:sodium ion-translocating decarboxylase beta subunit
MKKLITLIAVFALLFAISKLFIQGKSPDSSNKTVAIDLEEVLLSGKWVNKSDGYKVSNENEETKKRFKTINFKEDYTFSLDSAKQKYSGTWKVIENKVFLSFSEKELTHLYKNTDPNNAVNAYLTETETIQLNDRVGMVQSNILILSDGFEYKLYPGGIAGVFNFFEFSGFANVQWGHLIMILAGLFFIFLAIKYDYEPLLLIPIGVGILIGNIPMFQVADFNLKLGIYEPGSVMNYLYQGVVQGWYPPLIFLGIGAMTDFSSLISNPRLMLLGAAAQIGIFVTFLGALYIGFAPAEAGAIGIIGGADGPTAIFISSKLANGMNILADGTTVKNLIGPIAIAAYSYMALVPVIQPPIIKLLTSKKERKIKMKPPRAVTKTEKIMFPIVGLLLTAFLSPTSLPLLGMLFFGNLLKESGVTKRLAETARTSLIDIINILLGVTVGASTQADVFLTADSVLIFVLGAASFMVATAGGVIFAKIMNWLSPKTNPINPMIGAAGVSAVPDSARVVQAEGLREDPNNHLLMHAMAPNVSGVIGSAIAAGILLSFLM